MLRVRAPSPAPHAPHPPLRAECSNMKYMTDDEIISRVDANYFHAWRSIVSAKAGGEVVEGDGLLITNAGLPVPWFNIGFITRRLTDPDDTIGRITSYFDDRQ